MQYGVVNVGLFSIWGYAAIAFACAPFVVEYWLACTHTPWLGVIVILLGVSEHATLKRVTPTKAIYCFIFCSVDLA